MPPALRTRRDDRARTALDTQAAYVAGSDFVSG